MFLLATLLLAATFQFSLSSPTKTSAGIFRSNGTLVKILWQDEVKPAGVNTGTWDGTDQTGVAVAEGSYNWKVLKNTSVYTNTQVVGNTGIPTNTHGHQFFYPEGVAAEADGKFLVTPDWDEPHHSFHRMHPTTGHVEWESGENINANILKGVAREHDGPYAYVTAWQVQDGGLWVHTVYRVNVGNPALLHHERDTPFTVAGERIVVYGPGDFPEPDTLPDPERQTVPLISIACYDDKLFVTDSYAGKIWIYDEVTGSLLDSIEDLPLAMGIAIDQSSGTIWVGHELKKISAFNQAGSLLGTTTLAEGTEVRQLAHISGVLAVADRNDWIKKFSISGTTLTETDSYGVAAGAGVRAPNALRVIYGMAMNASGEICFTDRLGNGGRTQKIDANMDPVWQGYAMENTSNITFHPDNPNQKISGFRNFYNIPSDTTWSLLGSGQTEDYEDKSYFGLYEVGHLGPPRIVKFGSKYYFYFLGGDGIAVYEIVPAVDGDHGPTLELASVLGGSDPNPYGRRDDPVYVQANRYMWSWNDTEGDHAVDFGSPASPGEVFMTAYENYPAATWQFQPRSVSVDSNGVIWLVILTKENVPTPGYDPTGDGIWKIAPQGLNSQGHPIYRWEDAVKVISRPDGIAALGPLLQPGDNFGWMQAARADGRLYLLGYVQSPDNDRWWQNEGSWMAGNVVFVANETTGALLGFYKLPVQHVGLSPIPGTPGGVMLGSNRRVDTGEQPGTLQHYSPDLLRLNQFFVDPQFGIWDLGVQELPSGGLDSFVSVGAQKDPSDQEVKVWAADNWNQRVIQYTIDENIEEVSGTITLGAATGDQIRYHPRGAFPDRVVGAVLGGSNDADPLTGEYTTLYTIPSGPINGWNQATVSLGDYRHYRLAMPNGSYGNIAELELYRGEGAQRITGTTFGTPGSYQSGGNTYHKVFDGDVATFFDAGSGDGNVVGLTPTTTPATTRANCDVLNVTTLRVGGQ